MKFTVKIKVNTNIFVSFNIYILNFVIVDVYPEKKTLSAGVFSKRLYERVFDDDTMIFGT